VVPTCLWRQLRTIVKEVVVEVEEGPSQSVVQNHNLLRSKCFP
jgi:hypothetical protein